MGIEDAVIAQQAMVQQNIAMAVLKKSADMQQQIANIIAQSVSVPASSLGGIVNVTA